ncbi:hypothetical protein HELRODRAFT_171832 [Helobdella robusta]|uniref:Uncharacterized protein n=1 Tax=Helobdella robusta TaxID=6412 RepID=T1F4R5_HELRO|nr:hypothetical protein HELRODRAFT_171832 [Helobdella robusta]ESO05430.1 hypothetical protein HELRODRAFT_171832 [Helobdella robusta]
MTMTLWNSRTDALVSLLLYEATSSVHSIIYPIKRAMKHEASILFALNHLASNKTINTFYDTLNTSNFYMKGSFIRNHSSAAFISTRRCAPLQHIPALNFILIVVNKFVEDICESLASHFKHVDIEKLLE